MKQSYTSRINMFGDWWQNLPITWGEPTHHVHRNYNLSWRQYRMAIVDQIRDDIIKKRKTLRGRPKGERIPARVLRAERLERMNMKAELIRRKLKNK